MPRKPKVILPSEEVTRLKSLWSASRLVPPEEGKRQITMKTLGAYFGVSEATVSRLVRGKSRPVIPGPVQPNRFFIARLPKKA